MIVESWFKNKDLFISPPIIWNMPNLFHSCVVFYTLPSQRGIDKSIFYAYLRMSRSYYRLEPQNFPWQQLADSFPGMRWAPIWKVHLEHVQMTNVQLGWLDMRNHRPAKKEPLHCHTRWAPDTGIIIVINGVYGGPLNGRMAKWVAGDDLR